MNYDVTEEQTYFNGQCHGILQAASQTVYNHRYIAAIVDCLRGRLGILVSL